MDTGHTYLVTETRDQKLTAERNVARLHTTHDRQRHAGDMHAADLMSQLMGY